jgi:hypothetical protein
MARYSIVSIDNARVGQGGSRLDRGEFESADAAISHAEQLVDQALRQLGGASSAHDLMAQYMRRGSEVPMIYGEPRVAFHAYQYARKKANAMFATPLDG